MAKKQTKQKTGDKTERYLVVIDDDLVANLGLLAAAYGTSKSALVNNCLRRIIDTELPTAMRKAGWEPAAKTGKEPSP